jgi:Actin
MDETYLVNDAKEKASFVSLDFLRDLRTAKESTEFATRYVLPDYSTTFIG